jgi:malate dehydrogenase (oxaloacetate-decarboxylating)(NADP+)
MVLAASRAIAQLAREEVPDSVLHAYGLETLQFGLDYIIPKPFDPRVLTYVAPAVARAAAESGVAQEPIADLDAYRESLHRFVERSRGLMQPLIARAKSFPRKVRIVFPEGDDPQLLRAAQICVDEGICTPVLLGIESSIRAAAAEAHVELKGMEIEPINSPRAEQLAQSLWERRARKGMTKAVARQLIKEPMWYAVTLLREGAVDGLVGGLRRPYKETIGPSIKVLGLKEHARVVSGVYAMLFKERRLFLGDCTVNIEPDAETLSEIAINTARVAETFGVEPRVAMLSYSDFGEHHQDRKVETVRRAIELTKARWPTLIIDGEMQADTAIDPDKMRSDFPFCALDGAANVLVFPDLTSGNIAYKLLLKLGDAEALGPLVVGMARPVGAIPIGASVKEIVNITTYTVVRAVSQRFQPVHDAAPPSTRSMLSL